MVRRAALVAGPALIAGAVLVLLHGYAFGGKMANGDLPTFWLPTYCFLGKTLGSGHIPVWNPYVMAGVPFAADPQSGWMYVPVMALFTVLPCDVAIRWMVVLQPILAGLGIYAFLRSEGTNRVSATVGGLVLSMGIAGSQLTNSLPLAGALAWSALSLAACSRYVHAATWTARLMWGAATAASWGQLAAAHFSVGMLMGTGLLAVYLVTKVWDPRDDGRRPSRKQVVALGGALAGGLLLVNAAYLVPRIAYLPHTSLALGYAGLDRLATELSGFAVHRGIPASSPTWPLKLATTPGAHPGALALSLVFVPLASRRFRTLAIAFSSFGAVLYVLTQRSVASWIRNAGVSWRPVDTYLHSPEWWGYGLLVIMAVLAGLGLQTWLSSNGNRRLLWTLPPALIVWGILPPIFGAPAFELSFLWAGAAASGVVLAMAATRPGLILLVPVVVAAELVASGLIGYRTPPFAPVPRLLVDRAEPTIDTAAYVRPGPVARALQRVLNDGRYLTQHLGGWQRLQADPRSSLFEIEQAQGYNPVQLPRYWMIARKFAGAPLPYNLSLFFDPPPIVLDLLHVRYIVSGRSSPAGSSRLIDHSGRLGIYESPRSGPIASVVPGWSLVPTPKDALRAISLPGFRSSHTVVLESGFSLPPPFRNTVGSPGGGGGATVSEVRRGAQELVLRVRTDAPSVVLVRIPYERNWRAQIDGRDAPVVPADSVVQAVPVAAGSHEVRLWYDDGSITIGLAVTSAALLLLVAATLLVRARERRR